MEPGVGQVRAVIGGTGDYIGATGQITTTRNDDGSYDHVVELID
jgi:alpha-D-ribose 1-methylphosphonate 5-triphosphate synthase subunit PhnG